MKQNSTPSRRSFLKVGAATVASTGAMATAALAASPDDAELVRLGRELRSARAAWSEAAPAYKAADDIVHEMYRTRRADYEAFREKAVIGLEPGSVELSDAVNQAFLDFFGALHAPYEEDIRRGNERHDAVSTIQEAILAIPPHTPAGLAVHAEAVRWAFESRTHGEGDLDFDEECTLDFLDHVRRLIPVGRDKQGEA